MKWKDILCLDLSLMMIFGRHSLMQLHALTSVCRQRGFGIKKFLNAYLSSNHKGKRSQWQPQF